MFASAHGREGITKVECVCMRVLFEAEDWRFDAWLICTEK